MDPFYLTGRWKRVRERALRRDGYRCRESARYGKTREAEVVHHIYPLEDYPEYAYELWNLISLTKAMHNQMHDRATDKLTKKGIALQRRTKIPQKQTPPSFKS